MHYGEVPGIGKKVARVVQGTTMIGSDLDQTASFQLLDQVYDMGCNTFDTAHVYCGGESERIIGRWLQSRGLRERIVIVTKGAAHSEDRRRMTPYDIASDLHDSLARLKTDYIDLYLLHRDDPGLPVGPIMEALDEHVRAGKIRAIGASNWSPRRIELANDHARENSLKSFAAGSLQFSLAECVREPWPLCLSISGSNGTQDRDWFIDRQFPLLAYSTLASGFFSGRFRRDNLDTFGDRELDRVCIQSYVTDQNFQRLDRAAALGAEKGLTAAQIAVAYVMNQQMDVYAVVGPSSSEKYMQSVAAADLRLTLAEMRWLDLRSESR